MTIEQFENGVRQGAKILSRWANGEGIHILDAMQELRNTGFGEALIDPAFDIAINSEGYEYLIKDGLQRLLAEWNPNNSHELTGSVTA